MQSRSFSISQKSRSRPCLALATPTPRACDDGEKRLQFDQGRVRLIGRAANLGVFPQFLEHRKIETINDHSHEFFEILLCVGGEGVHLIDGIEHPLRAGDAHFLAPTRVHRYWATRGSLAIFNLMFRSSVVAPGLSEADPSHWRRAPDLDPFTPRLKLAPIVHPDSDAFDAVLASASLCQHLFNHDFADEEIRAQLRTTLSLLARAWGESELKSVEIDPTIERALQYVRDHYSEDLRLTDAARFVNRESSYFSEQFHRQTGQTFTAFLERTRIDAALALFRNTDFTVTEVAFRVGYNDASYFAKRFRRVVGVVPTACKDQLRIS